MSVGIKFLYYVTLAMLGYITDVRSGAMDIAVLQNFTINLVRTKHVVIFGCNRKDFSQVTRDFFYSNQLVESVNLNRNYTLSRTLCIKDHARTSIIVDCGCKGSTTLLHSASAQRYFNTTYQWLLWNNMNQSVEDIFTLEIDYLGPNAQVVYINGSKYHSKLWDIHSKGRHLLSPLEVILIAEYVVPSNHSNYITVKIHRDIMQVRTSSRRQFNGLMLRGATVIDLDNVTSSEQIEKFLSRPSKDSGIAAFIKYHYELLLLLRERFNFTVKFRNARGWAGRLGNTTFRLGFLGIMMRNEADVGASGAYNRINRFAEFDIIHQSWKFETAFLYRFSPDLDIHGKTGNFLAPFSGQVWLFATWTILVVNSVWRVVEWMNVRWRLGYKHQQRERKRQLQSRKRKGARHTSQFVLNDSESVGSIRSDERNNQPNQAACERSLAKPANNTSIVELSLKICAAICQQGMSPIPKGLPSRIIILTTFIFSVVLYNYYTSSVVGGLLASMAAGPSTVDEIVSSRLKLSFEDIGYYKVLFRENKSPLITRLIKNKLLPPRSEGELPVYTHLEDAIPYLKHGKYAFHCEVVDAYPEIAKHFDANAICALRVVRGLLETEILNWVVHKNSQYTEIFRVTMCWAREIGLVQRLLRQRQPRQPSCQSLYTVYPVSFFEVSSAFYILAAGIILSSLWLSVELCILKQVRYFRRNIRTENNSI